MNDCEGSRKDGEEESGGLDTREVRDTLADTGLILKGGEAKMRPPVDLS